MDSSSRKVEVVSQALMVPEPPAHEQARMLLRIIPKSMNAVLISGAASAQIHYQDQHGQHRIVLPEQGPIVYQLEAPGGQRQVWELSPKEIKARLQARFSMEWYTPPWVLYLALACLGRIDLDPCANPQKSVPAIRHYVGTAGQDGLLLPWGEQVEDVVAGQLCTVWAHPFTVFLNPPWGDIGAWAGRLEQEYLAGHLSAALLLVPVRTERPWFQALHRWPVWFPNERIHYCKEQPDGSLKEERGIAHASCLFYLGPDLDRFERAFGDRGQIYVTRRSLANSPGICQDSQDSPLLLPQQTHDRPDRLEKTA